MNRLPVIATFALVAAFGCVAANTASAGTFQVNATSDPDNVSAFTLQFGDGLGDASANITTTSLALALDDLTGTASLRAYYQQIAPLILPGGFSTGRITVSVLPGSSVGTYNPATGDFATSETYVVHFEGDLSAFGLQSPVLLPSNSVGVLDPSEGTLGALRLNWSGVGQLANPFIAGERISFTYACTVSTLVVPRGGFPTKPVLGATEDAASQVERAMNASLQSAQLLLAQGDRTGALNELRSLTRTIRAESGQTMSAPDAADLLRSVKNLMRDILSTRSGAADAVRSGQDLR